MHTRTGSAILALTVLCATFPAFAAKVKGTANLKDLQPAGMKDKDQKHQAYHRCHCDYSDRGMLSEPSDATDDPLPWTRKIAMRS